MASASSQSATHRESDQAAAAGRLSNDAKLLSHRGRGFGYGEATPDAVRAALRSGIRYLELDTRVGPDSVIYARHDPLLPPTPRGVTRLADLLGIAADLMDSGQTLCLDIKDFGFEQAHVELVERSGLARRTVFVSWIPQALTRLHAIAPSIPLILSHINLQFLPFAGGLADALLGDREVRLFRHVLLGMRAMDRPLRHAAGFQHAVLGRQLPERSVRLLVESGGGICVPTYCVCDALDAWCTRNSLQQWVYTANDATTYRRLCRRSAVQVIFSDDPLRVAGASSESE